MFICWTERTVLCAVKDLFYMYKLPCFITKFFICTDLSLNSGNSVSPEVCTQAHLKTNVLLLKSRFLLAVWTKVLILVKMTAAASLPAFALLNMKQAKWCLRWVHLGRTCGHSSNYWRLFEYCIPLHPTPAHTYTPFLVFPPSKLTQHEDHNRLQFEQVYCLKACTGTAARKQSVLPYCCSPWRQALPWLWMRTRIRAKHPFPPSPNVTYFS